MKPQETLPIFPLGTVLFPGGTLPLKIFEQRYLDMVANCLRNNQCFGVCLIKEGNEIGAPAVPEVTGCTAAIVEWDMRQLGLLHLKTQGVQRFRIIDRQIAKDGLISAQVHLLPPDKQVPLFRELRDCAVVLKLVMEKMGMEHFPSPPKLGEASWVGYRLAELLPMNIKEKQKILDIDDPIARLQAVREFLVQQGLLA
ncbi:MAG TPA: LON peptidase substrate-binding domain-containing protein [Burkholderiales bacterium]|nr:LON peptidase substrate-binding domain-containing protein [Burkholderiales bacterium]